LVSTFTGYNFLVRDELEINPPIKIYTDSEGKVIKIEES
jgi:hypothetical protein